MKYRIAWKRKNSDDPMDIFRGAGLFDSYEDARLRAEDLNKKYPKLFHWAERVRLDPDGNWRKAKEDFLSRMGVR